MHIEKILNIIIMRCCVSQMYIDNDCLSFISRLTVSDNTIVKIIFNNLVARGIYVLLNNNNIY